MDVIFITPPILDSSFFLLKDFPELLFCIFLQSTLPLKDSNQDNFRSHGQKLLELFLQSSVQNQSCGEEHPQCFLI